MKTEHAPSFGRNVAICVATALALCSAVELTCLSLGIAPLFTPNLPLNEKMRFLRDHRPGRTPITVVSGASIALNDIDSDLLEAGEGQSFVNLGANGVSVSSSEQFYRQLADLYPVREVIFAASPIEMRDAYRSDVEVPTPVFRRYLLGRMTLAEEFTYRDMSGLISYWNNWNGYHSRTSPTSMAFNKTGAVPLEIHVDASGLRGNVSATFDMSPHCTRCMSDVAQFCRDVRSEGRFFTIVLGPVLPDVIEHNPGVRAVIADRTEQVRLVAKKCEAQLFDITDYAHLDESCFANSLHLNAEGMSAMTAQLFRFRRGDSLPRGMRLNCDGDGLHLARTSAAKPESAIPRSGVD